MRLRSKQMSQRHDCSGIYGYLEDNGYPPHVVRGGAEGLIARWQDFRAEVEAGYLSSAGRLSA